MGRHRTYDVKLDEAERTRLQEMTQKGRESARTIRRVQTLLLVDEGYQNKEIARILGVTTETIKNTNKRYLTEGLDSALVERPRPGAQPTLDGRGEAHLIALACSDAPEGRDRWSLRLLAGKMVELEVVDTISYQTVRRTLKKTRSSRG